MKILKVNSILCSGDLFEEIDVKKAKMEAYKVRLADQKKWLSEAIKDTFGGKKLMINVGGKKRPLVYEPYNSGSGAKVSGNKWDYYNEGIKVFSFEFPDLSGVSVESEFDDIDKGNKIWSILPPKTGKDLSVVKEAGKSLVFYDLEGNEVKPKFYNSSKRKLLEAFNYWLSPWGWGSSNWKASRTGGLGFDPWFVIKNTSYSSLSILPPSNYPTNEEFRSWLLK